ncbi:phage integrase SAM-like domain-containing protein (plasmid) [Shewanella sp. HL-SH4]|uniref:phage integrase SAM-like domain-containing protein n=1 Tax=Shewanella sp. HL-SH4 TaxID=3436240 RepID=UPI003EBD5527
MAKQRKNLTVNKEKLKKTSVVEPTIDSTQNQEIIRPISPVVNYPNIGSKGGNGSNVNFTRFYGKGFDDITSRVYYTAKALLKNTDALSEETQKTYFTNGFSHFAEYLTLFRYSAGEDLTQDDITPELIEQYLLHLRGCELGYNTQKGYYTHLKSMLIYMRNKGYWSVIGDINLNNDFFPKNPFPNSSKRAKGEKSLTPHEKRQVVVALKQAIKPIYQKTEPLTGYELVVCLLAVAIQTGINTSPLLDMTTDSLTDHPLKDCRKLLTVFKKRGNATQLHNLRKSQELEVVQGIKLDVAYLIETIIERNSQARKSIDTDLVFVYEPRVAHIGAESGRASSLAERLLRYNIKKFIKEYDLRDEDGRTMKLNVSRFRKTFINGIYELSGESLLIAAQQAKHSGTGTLDHYLQAPEQSKRNLGLMGDIRVKELTCAEPSVPVGHCKDPKNGHRAPKDGTFCNDFLGCFRCKSFVITGDDLYKLFSFYWAIIRNRDEFGRKDWKRHLKNVLRVVDEEVVPEFTKLGQLQRVEAEKERARTNPHPYWQNLDMLKVTQ